MLSLLTADVEPRLNLVFQIRVIMNEPGYALGLVRGQCVHGVDDNGLDARLSSVSPAVIQDRMEKTFRLSRTGACGDDRGGRLLPGKPSKGHFLMQVRRKAQGNARKEILTDGRCSIGKLDRDVRSLENAAVLPQKPVHHAMKERRGNGEGRLEEVLNAFLDLIGQDGWDHLTRFHYLQSIYRVPAPLKGPSLHGLLC